MARRVLAFLAALAASLQSAPPEPPSPLKDARTWMIQFQKMESSGAVEALADSAYDLLVVEPTGTYRSGQDFDMKGMVAKLRAGRKNRVVLAYLDLAEADSNRSYWQRSWKSPSGNRPGTPDFLLKPDPDGWKDTYVVCYTDPRWKDLLKADVSRVMQAGFDGLYLDWLAAYEDETVAARIKGAGLDPAREMVALVEEVRTEARRHRSDALLVTQNAPYLLDDDARVKTLVDAVSFENTWYSGQAEADWGSDDGGDRPNRSTNPRRSTDALIAQYKKWQAEGKPVYTIDYCLKPDHAKAVYDAALALNFRPLVSRSALDRPTSTPPPGLTPRKP